MALHVLPSVPRGPVAALVLALAAVLLPAAPARAALFEDDEARRAILELRSRVTTGEEATRGRLAELARLQSQQLEQMQKLSDLLADQVQQLRRSLLDLNTQLEAQRTETARLRGVQEQLQRDLAQSARDQGELVKVVAELQRRMKDTTQGIEDRIRRIEPVPVQVDGREFMADPDEKRQFEAALATLRGGDFDKGASALNNFLKRWPTSGYADSARYWLGNAYYGLKNYPLAIGSFRALLANAADHPRAPEALLGVANCQIEMKDVKAARRTLEELLKTYPGSEAAVAGKDRLGTLKG